MGVMESIKQAVGISPPPAFDFTPLIKADIRCRAWNLFSRDEDTRIRAELVAALAKYRREDMVDELYPRCCIDPDQKTRIMVSAPRMTVRSDMTGATPWDAAVRVPMLLAEGVALLLDPVRNPERELERRTRELATEARDREIAGRENRERALATERAAEAERVRLNAWRARPRIERALMRLAAKDAKWRPLLEALASEPERPDVVPNGF